MSFDVDDGRGDENGAGPQAEEGGARRPLTDEERVALYREQVKHLHVIELVRAMVVDLVTLGYQKLGLTPETSELRDLDDARVAIETLRRLLEVLDAEGGSDEARAYRSTLAAMQLQFAQAAAEPAATSETSRPPGPTEPPAAAKRARKPAKKAARKPAKKVARKPARPRSSGKKKPASGAKD